MFFSIDRIVSGKAMLIGEDQKPLEVPLGMLPRGVKSGEMVFYGKEGFALAPDKTAERRSRIAGALEMLLNTKDEE